jgi:hypothetical protein
LVHRMLAGQYLFTLNVDPSTMNKHMVESYRRLQEQTKCLPRLAHPPQRRVHLSSQNKSVINTAPPLP